MRSDDGAEPAFKFTPSEEREPTGRFFFVARAFHAKKYGQTSAVLK